MSLRADEREPGLGLSLLVAAALVLGLFIAGGLHFITPAAKEEASLPVEVEVSLEAATPSREKSQVAAVAASASAAQAQPQTPDKPEPALEPAAQSELVVPQFAELMAVSAETASVTAPKPVEIQVEAASPAPAPELAPATQSAATSSLPGNMDLMPAPRRVNRLNPLAAGMPMPARPTQVEALPTQGEGLSSAQDAPEAGAAAPELQVTSVTGQDGEGAKPGSGIKVTLLINYLGVVESVEVIEGSPDRVADLLVAQGMMQRRFQFNPPLPSGQRVLRTYYIKLSAEDLP